MSDYVIITFGPFLNIAVVISVIKYKSFDFFS